ncbi:MAG: MBOAT family protein [Lachnospiraceae bacterium]|nr:MBOAT family protein [Lachnospiraceae bacterium]
MVFSSLVFIIGFMPLFFLIYYLIPEKWQYGTNARNAWLFLGSLLFYAYGEPRYVFLMMASIVVNYLLTLQIAGERNLSLAGKRRRKAYFAYALLFNTGMLFFFKYSFFLSHSINRGLFMLTTQTGVSFPYLPELELKNPIGISFYTFQILSYVIDVYYRRYAPERSILTLGTYISMFPQLIAGPIVTYPEVQRRLHGRHISAKGFDLGWKTFILGLAAKVLIANRIGILWTDIERIGYESISTPLAWMGAFAYSFQIYFDFYGYSLMAIGLGRMLGFGLPENFRDPYLARSATDFWRRWHITLGRWFRTYLYIPLGGSREGTIKTIRNIFLVWLFTGMWHGADWNFILWGMLFFGLLLLERSFLGSVLEKVPVLSVPYMLLVIPVSWVIFAISDLQKLGVYFTRLFPFVPAEYESNVNSGDFIRYGQIYALSFAVAILFCIPAVKKLFRRILRKPVGTVMCTGLFLLSLYFLAQGLDNPFLYYRF